MSAVATAHSQFVNVFQVQLQSSTEIRKSATKPDPDRRISGGKEESPGTRQQGQSDNCNPASHRHFIALGILTPAGEERARGRTSLVAEANPGLEVGSIQSQDHQGRQVKVVVHPGLIESQVESVFIVTFLFPSISLNTVRAREPEMGGSPQHGESPQHGGGGRQGLALHQMCKTVLARPSLHDRLQSSWWLGFCFESPLKATATELQCLMSGVCSELEPQFLLLLNKPVK